MREREPNRSSGATEPMPAVLASGPCLEDWDDPRHPGHWFYAWRRWQAAVRSWGHVNGYYAPGFPYGNPEALARTRKAWSRKYLRADGRGDLADYYDGVRADRPPCAGRRPDLEPTPVESEPPGGPGSLAGDSAP